MINAITIVTILILPFMLNWLFRKRIGRYLSYMLAVAVSGALVSAGLYLLPIQIPGQEKAPAILAVCMGYFSLLFWGLIWLWINAFKFKAPRPPITGTPPVLRRAGRIEPVFAANDHSSTHVQTGPIDAIYDDPPLDEVKRNFFARYWRGQYSLPFSFWVVGILAALVTLLVIVALDRLFDVNEYNPYASFAFFVSVWVFVVVSTIWDVVGLWRSATFYMHRRWRQGKATFWGGLVKLLIVASVPGGIMTVIRSDAPQMGELFDMAFRGDPNLPDYSLRIMRNGTEVEIVGGFKYGLTDDFRRLLKASPQIGVVHLDSAGGRIAEAMQVHDIIQQRGMVTYVVNECLSACTLAFAGGRERWLGSAAKLGFHGPSFPGMPEHELNSAIASQQQLLVRDGVDPYFVARALSTPADSLWTPTNQELFAARVVTNIAPPGKFAMSGFGAAFTPEAAGEAVTTIVPALAALSERDPSAANAIFQSFHQMYLNGDSLEEGAIMARAKIDTEVQKHLAFADDETMAQFARLIADEYRHIYALDRHVCYKYMTGEPVDISNYLSPELIERELDIQGRVIRTASQRQPMPQAAIDAAWREVLKILQAGPQKKNLALLGATPRPDQYGDFCQLYIALYEAILRLPPDRAAALVRALMSGKL